MSTLHNPEDEPFSHEAISHHGREDSTVNLLNNHSTPQSVSDLNNTEDSFYDNQGPSKASLYDPEKPEVELADFSRDRNFQTLGRLSNVNCAAKLIAVNKPRRLHR